MNTGIICPHCGGPVEQTVYVDYCTACGDYYAEYNKPKTNKMKTLLLMLLVLVTGICTAQTPRLTTAGEVQKLMKQTPKPLTVDMGFTPVNIWGEPIKYEWLFQWNDNGTPVMRMRPNSDTLEIQSVDRVKYIKVGGRVYSLSVELTEVRPLALYSNGITTTTPGVFGNWYTTDTGVNKSKLHLK